MPGSKYIRALLAAGMFWCHAGPASAGGPARAEPAEQSPRVDRLPVPAAGAATPDLGTLAQQQASASAAPGPALMVFISFSLSDATLKRLVEQAEAAGAVLLLRGLEQQSLRQTTEHARRLIAGHQVAWQIDPRAFKQYGVQQAPTFVLSRSGAGGGCGAQQCAGDDGFLAVAGDVSLDYALDHIGAAAPEYAGLARQYLSRMRRAR